MVITPEETINWKTDKTLKYKYATGVKHPNATSNGKIYQHVYVMSEAIKRPLNKNECVHHIDRDRGNNDLSNLRLLTKEEHATLHALEDKGYIGIVTSNCEFCRNYFEHYNSDKSRFCSHKCYQLSSRKFEVSREELHKLVWSKPTSEVAKLLGVSDMAVYKRCKVLNVSKPQRGYWNKVKENKIENIIPPLED